ncbi:MAG TPA: adenylate/guanylate cyclase domain-containing protein [Paracoccaceae bacterium]|nr:adenylate/guanylate cyclase domain-containing protein [Paracoccaceae bacterium]
MAVLARIPEFVLGRRPPRTIPDRVRQAIERDQRSSELLVCLAQFGAIAFFGGFYAITPKAFPPSVPFEPIPWTLAIYTLFTTFRLLLTLRNRLNPAFLALSVVIDIAVLMVTIWSFHLQYQAPATIYLKAPTLLYAFILIALRTMRFEAGYVILAGLATLLGWGILVAYAVMTSNAMQVTHNFAVYVTSDSVLIGAEIDKALSFAAVTGVLAIAVIRARRLMIAAATEAHAASELSRFFDPAIAAEIRMADAGLRPGDAMTRDAAVLMLDLRGFTTLSARLSPRDTLALIAEYQRRMVPAIEAAGGSIDKYLGDGIMATFGAARPSPSFAADALGAQMAVLAAAEAWNAERRAAGAPPIAIGAAVATGPLLFGVIGVENRLEFTVIGDVVNLAAKLEKHCKIARTPALATRAALDLACAQGFADAAAWRPRDQDRVEGVAQPVDLVAFDALRLPFPFPAPSAGEPA